MYEKVLSYIEAGKAGGAKCLAGGDKLGDKGYYIKPTVFADVSDDMKIAKEEVSSSSILNTHICVSNVYLFLLCLYFKLFC